MCYRLITDAPRHLKSWVLVTQVFPKKQGSVKKKKNDDDDILIFKEYFNFVLLGRK